MVSPYLIYGLVDPRSGELRYVGQTDHLLCQRLAQHEHAARRSKDRRMNTQWVRSLQAAGVRPEMFLLDRVSGKAAADEAERFFIAYFRTVGARLNNHTDGGEGCVGYHHSAAARERISAGKTGKRWTEERKQARRAVSPERELELVKMYRGGASLKVVGDAVGLSGAWASKMLKRHKHEARSPNAPSRARALGHRKLDDATEMKVVERYLSGLSTDASGKGLGLTGRAVARMLRRRGFEVRSSGAGRWLTTHRKAVA